MKRFTLYIYILLASLAVNAQGQRFGVPFFKNYTVNEYQGDERCYDIECDSLGHVFVANFKGLLYYDGVDWHQALSPGISRILALCQTHDGKVWFGGSTVFGYAIPDADSVQVHFIADENNGMLKDEVVERISQDKDNTVTFVTQKGNVFSFDGKKLKKIKTTTPKAGYTRRRILTIDDCDLVFRTLPSNGIVAIDALGRELYHLTAKDGLCSDDITDIDYDGKGSVWGTTDNGIFVVSAGAVFTHFGEKENLVGKVYSINEAHGDLLVGSLQGLFTLHNSVFQKVDLIDRACWQIVTDKTGNALVASANGVFLFTRAGVKKLSSRNSLSLLMDGEDGFLCGCVEGLYRYDFQGKETLVDEINNISLLEQDRKGGVWATTMDKETYYRAPGQKHFAYRKDGNGVKRLMLHYKDDSGKLWHSGANGRGIVCDDIPDKFADWLKPFSEQDIQTVFVRNNVAWMGGAFGIYRFDFERAEKTHIGKPKIYIRDFSLTGRDLKFAIAIDIHNPFGQCYYSYRMHKGDEWSHWNKDNDFIFNKQTYGPYELQVRVKDMFGRVVESEVKKFYIPWPWYLKWYIVVMYIIIVIALAIWFYLWRMNRVSRQKEQLEKIVNERTKELKDAHAKLVRQEKEATAGKLTRGLIDRILNPLNYINNFSHLTLGLVKDLKDDVEDMGDEDSDPESRQDAQEDAADVLDMMNQNLEKIEQHGVSTTRILKAMEEMLKERKGKVQPADIAHICQQCVDVAKTYFADDISRIGLEIEWELPKYPITADVISEQLSQVIMSMLSNSVYAVKKKYNDPNLAMPGYQPTVTLKIAPASGTESPHILIHDNGIGIEESILDKIFDPFFTTKPTGEAPGVGLYLAKQFIEDVGGTITAKSKKNEWTEFDIALP